MTKVIQADVVLVGREQIAGQAKTMRTIKGISECMRKQALRALLYDKLIQTRALA